MIIENNSADFLSGLIAHPDFLSISSDSINLTDEQFNQRILEFINKYDFKAQGITENDLINYIYEHLDDSDENQRIFEQLILMSYFNLGKVAVSFSVVVFFIILTIIALRSKNPNDDYLSAAQGKLMNYINSRHTFTGHFPDIDFITSDNLSDLIYYNNSDRNEAIKILNLIERYTRNHSSVDKEIILAQIYKFNKDYVDNLRELLSVGDMNAIYARFRHTAVRFIENNINPAYGFDPENLREILRILDSNIEIRNTVLIFSKESLLYYINDDVNNDKLMDDQSFLFAWLINFQRIENFTDLMQQASLLIKNYNLSGSDALSILNLSISLSSLDPAVYNNGNGPWSPAINLESLYKDVSKAIGSSKRPLGDLILSAITGNQIKNYGDFMEALKNVAK